MRDAQIRSLRHRFLRRLRLDEAPAVAVLSAAAGPALGTSVPILATRSSPARVTLRVSEPEIARVTGPDIREPAAELTVAPGRVLLVASDRRFRALAATLLSQRGYAVVVARGCDDVSELAERERADVVVIDASASLTAAARQTARLGSLRPRVGVVAVSGESGGTLATLPVLAKWSGFDKVLAAVDRSCADVRCARGDA